MAAMARSAPYNRDQALETAMKLFRAKGYHATSLKDLEAGLKMKPGSIYAAFTSKEALFRAALARYHQAGLAQIDACIESAASPLQGLMQYVRSQMAGCDQSPPPPACMLARTAIELSHDDGPAAEDARAFLAGVEARLADHIRAAQSVGEIAPEADPARLARRVQAKMMGATVFAQRRTSASEMEDLVEDLAQEISALRGVETTA
ncbi:TetR/AcrR family transcriptional regulator [Rhodobacteraceae bacterium NNCM2]|nr:TetR/AcrR family transcriptional regulator [Coraliihabitans acroporae]